MVDFRIKKYIEVINALKSKQFQLDIPIGKEDEIGELGKALIELREILKYFEENSQLALITDKINAGFTLDEVLNYVFDSFQFIIPYDRIGFALIQEDGQVVRARWGRSKSLAMKIEVGYFASLAGSSLQKIIETGQPRIINDLEAYLSTHPQSDSTRKIVEEGMRSSLTCPVIARGKPIGFMFFSSMKSNAYKDVHIDTFLRIAGEFSIIVEKSKLYQELADLNQLKNKFIGIVAHDLRSPIAIIKGYIGLFLGNLLGDISDKQREFLTNIDRVCENMLNLINDLLDISAIESGKLELDMKEVDLADYLRDYYDSNNLLAKAKSIEFQLDLDNNLPKIVFDPQRINQVITNLVINAIKFSYPESVITLRAKVVDDEVQISVQDKGQGIPEDQISKLFQEFSDVRSKGTAGEKSTGLGLAIVKRIVSAHNGRVWVESKVNAGSTFTFSLPIKRNVNLKSLKK